MPVKMADVSASKALFKSDFLLRCLPRDNCATAIELLLALPETAVLAIGSRNCLHFMHQAAGTEQRRSRLYYLPQCLEEYIDSSHLESVAAVCRTAADAGAKAIVLYLCCADVLIGTDYGSLCDDLSRMLQIHVLPLQRGFVATRRINTVTLILDEIERLLGNSADIPKLSVPEVALLSRRPLASNASLCTWLSRNGFVVRTNHCATLEEYRRLTQCRCAIGLDGFGCELGQRLMRLKNIPLVPLLHRYNIPSINNTLAELGGLLGISLTPKIESWKTRLEQATIVAHEVTEGKKIAVGIQEHSFELAAALIELKLPVAAVFCDALTAGDEPYIKELEKRTPTLPVYVNSRVTQEDRDCLLDIRFAIGAKAGFSCQNASVIPWNDRFSFGYEPLLQILEAMI